MALPQHYRGILKNMSERFVLSANYTNKILIWYCLALKLRPHNVITASLSRSYSVITSSFMHPMHSPGAQKVATARILRVQGVFGV